MVKIMIERCEFSQIGGEERCTVKFSETADLLADTFVFNVTAAVTLPSTNV